MAVENARLFAEELRRSRQLSFLNNISRVAISSEDAEQMLAEIVSEIQKTFRFDHIGIGILDYVTKDVEIKAEAGTTAQAKGKRIPLGVGILGRVARTGERALVQNAGEGHLLGILPESHAVLCIPITYGETQLGVLNVESREENAFSPQDVLIMLAAKAFASFCRSIDKSLTRIASCGTSSSSQRNVRSTRAIFRWCTVMQTSNPLALPKACQPHFRSNKSLSGYPTLAPVLVG